MCIYNNTHIRMWQQLKKKGPWKRVKWENINILWLWWHFRFFAFLILFECFYLGQKLILWLNEAMKSFPFWKTNNEWESKAKIWPKVWVRAKLNTNTHCIITEPEQLWCSERKGPTSGMHKASWTLTAFRKASCLSLCAAAYMFHQTCAGY